MIKLSTEGLISVNPTIEKPIAFILHSGGVLCEYEENDPQFYFDLQTAMYAHGYQGYTLCGRGSGMESPITEQAARLFFGEEDLVFRDEVMVMLGNIEEAA